MTDILPSHDEINAARKGIYLQLSATTNIVDKYGSLAAGIEELGLGDFIENTVEVLAFNVAWVRVTENRLNRTQQKPTKF